MTTSEQITPTFNFGNIDCSKNEILYDGNLYDVSTFIHRHPGGEEIIRNFMEFGEDATLAIQQFHSRSIDKVLKMIKTLPNRPEPEIELTKEMEQLRNKNAAMTSDFVKLYMELKEEGMFKPDYAHWTKRFVEMITFTVIGYYVITRGESLLTRLFGSFILTMAWGRAGWIGHEFGHMSATGNPTVDRLLHSMVTGFYLDWSAVWWWRRHHNGHHAMTNRVKNDPDVDLLSGFMASNTKIFDDPKKDSTTIHRYQIFFRPFFSPMLHLYWQFGETITHLIKEKKQRKVELFFIFCHYVFMYQIGFQMWFVTLVMFSMYLFGNTSVSHSFVRVTTQPKHWIEQSFLSTVDIEQRPWCDWWMGYLNYQIEHHLFPTLPQFRSPLIVERVKALADKHGLPYYVYSYKDAVIKTIDNIVSVSHFLRWID